MAIKYYDTFQKLKSEGIHDLNVATIFTYQANEDAKENKDYVHSREVLDRIMNDYNETFKTNYDTDNFEGYFSDVSKRMKEVVREEKLIFSLSSICSLLALIVKTQYPLR